MNSLCLRQSRKTFEELTFELVLKDKRDSPKYEDEVGHSRQTQRLVWVSLSTGVIRYNIGQNMGGRPERVMIEFNSLGKE